jgi:DNA topoisomerase-1
MKLVIVESPAKGRTVQSYLGKDYKVLASMGHVRDLPKSEIGVDVENNFQPKYIIPTKAKKNLTLLKKESAKAEETILATDEDREGEAISWHLAEALKLKNPKRIVFHEITEDAINQAILHPRKIDIALVNSQQSRRILDRLVGYKLSPFLWKKVSRGLSAGRVQSVAVRLVVDRENEIKAFKPDEYWQIIALLKKQKETQEFQAHLIKYKEKLIEKLDIKNSTQADKILEDLKNSDYIIEKVEKKETKKNPFAPFTTSTLQQTASNKFGFSAKFTMQLAQKLYEQGHITYHRTDSLNLSEMSLGVAKKFIIEQFGKNYYNFRKFKSKGNAQDAHEAIRPTRPNITPESLKNIDPKQLKLYTLIWQRFIASQMSSAIFDSVLADISSNDYLFRANGQTLKFEGFLKIYKTKFEENELPALQEKEKLDLVKIESSQHFTEPPARYNEASLIKALEKFGIGRPSTYAPTLTTIQVRNYIAKNEQKRFFPTEMGIIVNNVLMENFPEIVDIDFTAKMEKELDQVAEGKDTWQKTLKDFYIPFAKNLEEKYKEVKKENTDVLTDKICPECAKPMVEKLGRFGRFYACTGFPECKHTESLETKESKEVKSLNIKCPKCEQGQIIFKKSKRGKIFYGCSYYPKCTFAVWDKPFINVEGKSEFCPKCQSILVEKKNKQISCSSKECDFKK